MHEFKLTFSHVSNNIIHSYRIKGMDFEEVDDENVTENSDYDEILDAAIT